LDSRNGDFTGIITGICTGMTAGRSRPRHLTRMIRDPGRAGIGRGAVSAGRRLLAAAGLVLTALAGGCAAPAVDVALVGLAPLESTLLEQRLRLDFRLQNASQRSIQATGLDVVLDVNGRQLARGVDNGVFRLDPLSETRVSAIVSTSLLEVARQLLTLVERDRFDYRLRGRVYLDGWPRSIAFTRSGEITRDQLERLAGIGGRSPAPLRLE
jgi:LEA14-like dessication related protein